MEVSGFQCVTTTFLPSLLLHEVESELLRQVRGTERVDSDEIDDIVRSMMDLSLDQIICSLQDQNTFPVLIENARRARQSQPLCASILDALSEPIALSQTTP